MAGMEVPSNRESAAISYGRDLTLLIKHRKVSRKGALYRLPLIDRRWKSRIRWGHSYPRAVEGEPCE